MAALKELDGQVWVGCRPPPVATEWPLANWSSQPGQEVPKSTTNARFTLSAAGDAIETFAS